MRFLILLLGFCVFVCSGCRTQCERVRGDYLANVDAVSRDLAHSADGHTPCARLRALAEFSPHLVSYAQTRFAQRMHLADGPRLSRPDCATDWQAPGVCLEGRIEGGGSSMEWNSNPWRGSVGPRWNQNYGQWYCNRLLPLASRGEYCQTVEGASLAEGLRGLYGEIGRGRCALVDPENAHARAAHFLEEMIRWGRQAEREVCR